MVIRGLLMTAVQRASTSANPMPGTSTFAVFLPRKVSGIAAAAIRVTASWDSVISRSAGASGPGARPALVVFGVFGGWANAPDSGEPTTSRAHAAHENQ